VETGEMERAEAASMLVDGELRGPIMQGSLAAAAAGHAKNMRERLDFSQPHALEDQVRKEEVVVDQGTRGAMRTRRPRGLRLKRSIFLFEKAHEYSDDILMITCRINVELEKSEANERWPTW
jgi:hypothetical protein